MEVAFCSADPGRTPETGSIEAQVAGYAPFRYVVLWTTALMLISGMVSSSARALTLGDAAALSSVGQPLRVAIALTPTATDQFAPNCFSLIEPTGDGPPAIVTAKVSLERGAAGLQLVVTTTQSVSEPALRLAIEARCGTLARRDYVLLLDQSTAATAPVIAAAMQPRDSLAAAEASAPYAREP
jgi:hypothetical protein